MRGKFANALWVAVVCLLLAVPATVHAETANGNGGLGNGMGISNGNGTHNRINASRHGTGMYIQSHDGATRSKGSPNYEVSIYGTGTGSQFWNVNANANNSGPMDRNTGYRTQSNTNSSGYRIMETTSNGMDWGWLGLLGLIGLFGMRGRDPQRDRDPQRGR